MKQLKKLSLLIVLLSCWSVNAQRIDYALNHQEGIDIVTPIGIQVVDQNQYLVSYKAIDLQKNTCLYISVVGSDGRVVSTHQKFIMATNDAFEFDITSTGINLWNINMVAYGTSPFYYGYIVYGVSFNADFEDGKTLYEYHGDSLIIFQFTANAQRFALIEKEQEYNPRLRVGKIEPGMRTKNVKTIPLDSQSTYWWSKATWLNDNNLYINLSPNAIRFQFDDSNNVVSQENVFKADCPVLFREKMFFLTKSYNMDNNVSSVFLRDSTGATIRYFDGKDAMQPYIKLLSTPHNLISIHQQVHITNNVNYDSLIINYYDSTLAQTHHIPVAFPNKILDIKVDSKTGQLAILGRDNFEIVLILVNKNGVVSAVNEISQQFKLNAYPNPVNQILNLNLMSQARTINAYNTVGQLVLTTNAVTQLDVSAWANGLYMIEVLDEINQRIAITRILKQ